MIIDNFVEAAKSFLSCFNLRLENEKTNILSNELLSNNPINILDYNNDVVGNIYTDDIYYRINIMLEDKILSATVYQNMKEKSTYHFKYYINDVNTYKTTLKGFYTSRSNDGKIIYSNEYRIPGSVYVNKECNFNSLTRKYKVKDKKRGYMCNMKDNIFEFICPEYSLIIKKYPNNIYCEKKYNNFNRDDMHELDLIEKNDNTDTFMGYEVDWNNASFSEEVSKILEYLSPDYYEFIRSFKSSSDNVYEGLFYNTINKTIKDSKTRKLFKTYDSNINKDNNVKSKRRKDKKNK